MVHTSEIPRKAISSQGLLPDMGSAREAEYQIGLAHRLGFLEATMGALGLHLYVLMIADRQMRG